MLNAQSARLLVAAPWILRRRLREDTDRCRHLRDAALVTLDVFDTALVRTLAHHDDVFALAAWRAVRRLGLADSVEDLAASRRVAHRRALEAADAAGRHETTIEEIYAHHPITDPDVRAALLAEELATERDVCRANAPILALYRKLKAAGRRVAFLSDTPFAADFVRELLREAGYEGALEVHVSSAYGTTKAHGALFDRVAGATGVPAARIVHIGDNLRSDVLRARERGVAPLWYRPRLRMAHPAPADGSAASIARSVASGTRMMLARGGCAKTMIGATIAGPVYLAFTQWLMAELRREPVARVFFLARDAYILRAFYERLRDPARDPRATYLVVSRRSLVFPLIERVGESELDVLCSHERPLPVRDFLGRIGLAAPAEIVARHGLTLDTIVAGPAEVAALRALFVALAPLVLERAREERVLLLAYLAQEGFGGPGETLALCDVGWNGKSQRALASVLADPATRLDGYYVGTSEAVKRLGATGGAAAGWLVEDGRPRFGIDVSNLSWVLLELIFSAPHASAIGYARAGAHVTPVYRDEAANPGFQEAVRRIQAGALMFLEAYTRAFGGLAPLPVEEAEAVGALARLVATPTPAEAAALGDVAMIEGMGDTRTGYAIAKPPPWRAVLRNPRALAAAYRETLWRRGFAVRLLRSQALAGALYGGIERLRTLRGRAAASRAPAVRPEPATVAKAR